MSPKTLRHLASTQAPPKNHQFNIRNLLQPQACGLLLQVVNNAFYSPVGVHRNIGVSILRSLGIPWHGPLVIQIAFAWKRKAKRKKKTWDKGWSKGINNMHEKWLSTPSTFMKNDIVLSSGFEWSSAHSYNTNRIMRSMLVHIDTLQLLSTPVHSLQALHFLLFFYTVK